MKCNFLQSRLILFIIVALVVNGNAQQVTNRFSIQLSGGAAIPIGKFGKKTLSNHPDSSYGLAKPGPALCLKAGYQLNERFSLSILVSGMLNREDKKAFESAGGYNTPNAWSSITVHSWKTLGIMAGSNYFAQLGKKGKGLVLVPSIYAGVIKSGFPGDSAVYHSDRPGSLNDFITASWREKFPMRWAFCYQAGAGIQYPLSHNLFFDCGIDFFNSVNLRSAKYDYDPRRFKVSTINIHAGARILL
jgi:opacity protein-like surface antigen